MSLIILDILKPGVKGSQFLIHLLITLSAFSTLSEMLKFKRPRDLSKLSHDYKKAEIVMLS